MNLEKNNFSMDPYNKMETRDDLYSYEGDSSGMDKGKNSSPDLAA